MKVSRLWLQRFFDKPLPSAEELRDAFTFHAFEVEEVDGEILDLKVLPDRAGYAMSHRGIAKELSAILRVPMKVDPLIEPLPTFAETPNLKVTVDPEYVHRHTAALVTGVAVGPSPAWLKDFLESVGQRSINNIVDISNFVMLNIGQPNHAFDLAQLEKKNGEVHIDIRKAKEGEKVTILSGEEYTLSERAYVISDGVTGTPLDIAGIKGGLTSGISESTTDLFISVGNYDGTLLRKASQSLKLVTDASQRYQNRPSPELTAYGMRDVLSLILEIAGGTVIGVVDVFPKPRSRRTVSISVGEIRAILGNTFGASEVDAAFSRLNFDYEKKGDTYTVHPPFERSDIVIPEDLAEEVGRIIGYDHIEAVVLPPLQVNNPVNALFYYSEKIKTFLIGRGYSEVYTSVFTSEKGERQVSNKVDSDTPYLRKNVMPGVLRALKLNLLNRPVLGISDVQLFEIGKVFTKNGEHWQLALGVSPDKKRAKKDLEALFEALGGTVAIQDKEGVVEINLTDLVALLPQPSAYDVYSKTVPAKYVPFSRFPFVARDVAVWTPEGTSPEVVEEVIRASSGALVHRIDLFDSFTKEGRTSYAYRLVFLSEERTLTDEEVNEYMGNVYSSLKSKTGFEVR